MGKPYSWLYGIARGARIAAGRGPRSAAYPYQMVDLGLNLRVDF